MGREGFRKSKMEEKELMVSGFSYELTKLTAAFFVNPLESEYFQSNFTSPKFRFSPLKKYSNAKRNLYKF